MLQSGQPAIQAVPERHRNRLCDNRRAIWARFLKKVFAADPLVCAECHGPMRIVAFIEDQRVGRAILEHLTLWAAPRPRPPPVAEVGPADCEYVPCED